LIHLNASSHPSLSPPLFRQVAQNFFIVLGIPLAPLSLLFLLVPVSLYLSFFLIVPAVPCPPIYSAQRCFPPPPSFPCPDELVHSDTCPVPSLCPLLPSAVGVSTSFPICYLKMVLLLVSFFTFFPSLQTPPPPVETLILIRQLLLYMTAM